MNRAPTIVLSSGELSGDVHAAHVVRRLRDRFPGARVRAFGGDECARAGAELLFHYRDYAILGFTGVVAELPRLWRLERAMRRQIAGGADLFIPVDYPGLNMRLAAYARSRGVPVLYYIGPQVWAWGAGRIEKLARAVDRMAVILPFEVELYARRGIPVEFVGHPFVVDHELPNPLPQDAREGLGLLPGSRVQEVRRILPILLEAAKRMGEKHRDFGPAVVGRSPAVPRGLYESMVTESGVETLIDEDALGVMRRSRLLLVASGTATLQGALMETPLVIVYKVSALNYELARRLVKIPRIGLVNVIMGEEVCPEFVQRAAEPGAIASAALSLLEDPEQSGRMVERFRGLRRMLGGGGGCARVAEIAAELLEAR